VRVAGVARGLRTAVGVLLVMAVCLVSAAGAFASGWTIGSVPPPALPNGHLSAVSCSSSKVCTAVGYFTDATNRQGPLAEAWNGSGWRIQNTPNPIDGLQFPSAGVPCASPSGACPPQDRFTDVSCTSPEACTAVGYFTNAAFVQVTLAERWNGRSWIIENTPKPVGATQVALSGVSCTAGSCTAVGSYTSRTGRLTALAERWRNGRWSIARLRLPRGSRRSSLAGLSCSSPQACEAVGFVSVRADHESPLVERLTGRRWSTVPIPRPDGAKSTVLSSVACSSGRSCTAVGTAASSLRANALAERWNGRRWVIERTRNPAIRASSGDGPADVAIKLSAVSCVSARSCTAVGSSVAAYPSDDNFDYYTLMLVERWNGSRWSVQSAPSPVANPSYTPDYPTFSGVSCSSTSACTAVGPFPSNDGPEVTLAERWNGTRWALQNTANGTGTAGGELDAISCASTTACMAVGSYLSPRNVRVGLAEHWDGSSWTIDTPPTPSGFDGLSGVTCTSPATCIAVGSAGGATLAESWNGSTWTIQSTPTPSGANRSGLNSVSCTSGTDCIAVGSSVTCQLSGCGSGVNETSLAERWNGSSWTIQGTPKLTGASQSGLSSVSCTSATSCIAVGLSDGNDHQTTLAEAWNGLDWKLQSIPDPPGATFKGLSAVSCSSANACIAVGWYATGQLFPQGLSTLAERWDGMSWTLERTPNPPGIASNTMGARLDGVSCVSDTACTAVGSFGTEHDSAPNATLAEVWDGTDWKIQNTPTPGSGVSLGDVSLTGVSCTSAAACSAVGTSPTGPLVERKP
jgi:hypothetical protein